ncbi:putative toxin-antitoxin system toxin component, PIN family [Pedobacter sp. WC2501]|uniref:putative toxin-antitoxin system toxin component, PIN family n=1 Tax=Pedobacter sp. WC2501 TaxID=3461400 RepID=UPI0040453EF0
MRNLKSRIILDTNLWISFLISKDFSRLDEIIFSKKSILIFSQELLEEFLEVVKRQSLGVILLKQTLKNYLKL